MPRAAFTTPRRPVLPRWVIVVSLAGALLFLLAAIASIGGPHDPLSGLAAVLYTVVRAGAPAGAYLAAGVGFGTLLAPLYRGARERFALQAGLGIALLLTLSHLLGWAGAFGTRGGLVVAAGVVGLGLLLLARQLASLSQSGGSAVRIPPVWAAGLPALALLLVAASNPPGWLWTSEGRGYDALEYHLQLPQEWLALGRIRPLPHNVYSYLPGYVESAFLHMAVMTGVPAHPSPESRTSGLLAGDGMGVLSCQLLHAGIAVLAAVVLSRLVGAARRLAAGADDDDGTPGAGAGVVFLSIPWTIVTGSLPYNDLGVVLLLGAAMVAALEGGLSPARRGLLVGLLIGGACGVKPTALLLGAPPVALLLIGMMPARQWAVSLGVAVAAGAAMLAPWMVRNWIASGNPVFPAAATAFGAGHWSAEQVSRFAAAHRFDGTLVERLRLVVLPEAGGRSVHRDLLHPQWSAFFPVVVLAILAALVSRHRRVAALLCGGIAVQLVAWLFATHVQSRFALPMVVPGTTLIGLALGAVGERGAVWGRVAGAIGALVALVLVIHATVIFSAQGVSPTGEAHPNAPLIGGPPIFTGEDLRGPLSATASAERAQVLERQGPTQLANLVLPPGGKLYLLGDSTPLYFTVPVIYSTTFDRSLLADAIARAPDDPGAWAGALRRAGVTHILANLAELTRLESSHFLDPDLKPDAIRRFLSEQTRPIRLWPELGTGLYELGAPPR